jgi:surfeit locus 1 family protein
MRFRSSWTLTFSLLAIALIFSRLGFWQLERGKEKQLLFDRFNNAPLMEVGQALKQESGFFRVEAYGRFDEKRHVLLDNKLFNGRAGVHVLTPFYLVDGRTVLINRGWLPLAADRRSLPPVPTDPEMLTVSGLLRKPSAQGPRLGDADVLVAEKWPQLVTYFELDSIATALGTPLEPWLIHLDAEQSAGFKDREWKAAVMGPEIHRAYALQWFSLMLATLIIWLALGLRKHRATVRHKNT